MLIFKASYVMIYEIKELEVEVSRSMFFSFSVDMCGQMVYLKGACRIVE